MSKAKSNGISSLFQLIGIALMFLAFYELTRLKNSDRFLAPFSIMALLTGVILEGRRLTEKWSIVFYMSLGSFFLSLSCFIPGKKEHPYVFDDHITAWPYYFIFIFGIFSIVRHKYKVTAQLTEGITLLQSIALIYWLVDENFFTQRGWFIYLIMALIILFTLISLFHAFTHFNHSRTSRLLLSIWSSLIMLLFAIDNICQTYKSREMAKASDVNESMLIFLKFFLLGVSGVYVLQNVFMLIGFLPGRGTFFNRQYFKDVRELKDDHVKRYSEEQVSILYSFICLVLCGTAFYLNYHYNFLPRNLAIWTLFFIMTPLLNLSWVNRRKRL